ncbi:kinase domain-containing protein [Aspergillus aurantiobrunneus]
MPSNPSLPRQFPTSGFTKLEPSTKIEEELLPLYKPDKIYPVQIGEVFASKYQVVSKLGYGISSTVWLCRHLQELAYYTLKVCTLGERPNHEIALSKHRSQAGEHAGRRFVRLVLDSFHVPLGMSVTEFQNLLPENEFSKKLTQRSAQLLLIGLAFMHDNNVIYTVNISSNNILRGIEDSSILSEIENREIERPIARKILDDRMVYKSRSMPICTGLPVISDFGEARFGGQKRKGDIMPGIYRAPEVISDMEWDCKVDVWSLGATIFDLAEDHHLFFAKKDGLLNDEQHLAEMVALMGPPPLEFLRRSQKSEQFWDSNWKGSTPIPQQSFEDRARQFSGEDKALFLGFLRQIFRWLPEERPSAEELAYDDFLMQPFLAARDSA